MAIVAVTVLSLFLLIAVTLKVAEWVTLARDKLRDRYASPRWKPASVDFMALPLWIALELFCFVTGIVIALILVLLAYQTAKSVRDWWHAGHRTHGR